MMKAFSKIYSDRKERFLREMEQRLPREEGYAGTVISAMNYSMDAGGKRLRPLLMESTFRLFCREEKTRALLYPVLYSAMTAMEMIHTFSLCHDDLPCMDGDRYRRGRESTWYHYTEAMGTLAGDALSLYAFQLLYESFAGEAEIQPRLLPYTSAVFRLSGILARSSGIEGMLGGQSVDVEKNGVPLSEDELLYVYRGKTAALLCAAMEMGAVLGGAEKEALSRLRSLAEKLGIAFQIQDDILDLTSTEEVLGKPVHSDEGNDKYTFALMYGLEASRQRVRELSGEAETELRALSEELGEPEETEFLTGLIRSLAGRSS